MIIYNTISFVDVDEIDKGLNDIIRFKFVIEYYFLILFLYGFFEVPHDYV